MRADQFTERLAKVRHRFASTLEGKIKDTYGALPHLTGNDARVVDAVGEAYRRIHSIAGIGKTVGFAATGRAARDVENVLLPAHSTGRGLKADEVASLKRQLQLLRDAARRELDLAAMSRM
jgi:chemotaxis protein histidine kinase CheA